MENKEEFWVRIKDYEDKYEISNLGNVRNIRNKNKYLNQTLNGPITKQYLAVTLISNGKIKTKKIHQLVFFSFNLLINKKEGWVVDHIDNNQFNNDVKNLQYITKRENNSKDLKNKTSKYVGVYWEKRKNKWVSRISFNNKTYNLGSFVNEDEAGEYYLKALNSIEENGEIICKRKEHSSKYKGVSFCKKLNKWRAAKQINGKLKHLGYFTNEEDARDAYISPKI